MAAAEYDPSRTNIDEDKRAAWLREKISGDLEEVPGIGRAYKTRLTAAGIENTFQLIGKYLLFKNGTMKEHQNAMYLYLKSQGINKGRNNIVLALAEKCETYMQGIYDSSFYTGVGDEDDEEDD